MFLELVKNNVNENKENCLFITKDYLNGNRKMQFGQNKYIIESLSEKYNLFFLDLGKSKTQNDIFRKDKTKNYILFLPDGWDRFRDRLLRKKTSGKTGNEVNDFNVYLTMKEYELFFSDLRIDRIFIQAHTYSVIPSTEYAKGRDNSFHDYIGNDKTELKEIADLNKKLFDRIYDFVAPPLAFMWFINFVYYTLLTYLSKSGNIKSCNVMTDDPSTSWSYFFENIGMPNFNTWYFADDNRGTRNFKGFPLLQFRIMHGLDELKKPLFSQKKKLLYNGSILNNRGECSRYTQWKRYLKNLNIPNSSIYTFLKFNSDSEIKSKAESNIKKLEDEGFLDIYKEVINHKMYKGMHGKNSEFQIAQDYDYVLCLKPLTKYDSLNQKPGYCMLDVLPLLAEDYDPENLYKIPIDIKKKITVSSSKDIEDKVKYFDKHKEERIEIINRLKEHFKFEDIRKNYKEIIKNIF